MLNRLTEQLNINTFRDTGTVHDYRKENANILYTLAFNTLVLYINQSRPRDGVFFCMAISDQNIVC